MNINKHAIILPALITSAVSLHVLSYYIEEPEEIVYNPIQTSEPSPTITTQPTNQIKPTNIIKETIKPIPKPTEKIVKETPKIEISKTAEPIETPKVIKKPEPLKTPEPIQSTTIEQIVELPKDEIIKQKDFKEIILEARLNSGRIDPFISLKPPKIDKLPEIPKELIEEKKALLAIKMEKEREELLKQAKIDASKNDVKIKNNNLFTKNINNKNISNKSKVKPPVQIPKTDAGKKIIVDNKNTEEEILVSEAKRLSEGLKLTGIVTGTKPLAILSINDESKLLGVGDEINNNGDRLRIVSIDFNKKSVLITDGIYKAKLLIEEE